MLRLCDQLAIARWYRDAMTTSLAPRPALWVVAVLGAVVVAGSGRRAAAEPRPKDISIRVTATASSAMAKHPAWRAIGQITAERWGWCPDRGDGTGESISFAFDDALPLTELRIVAGLVPDWGVGAKELDHGMPERLEVTTDHQKLEVKLKRGGTASGSPGYDWIALSGAPVRSVALKILSVNPGKVPHTCINSVHFGAANTNYRPVYGIEAATLKDLPRFANALDTAFKRCDANGFAQAIRFPLRHDHEIEVPMGVDAPAGTHASYRSAQELAAACRVPGSILQLGLAGAVRHEADTPIADDIAHPFSETAGEVRLGDWQSHAWWLAETNTGWRLTRMLTSEDRTADPLSDIAELAGQEIAAWNHDKLDVPLVFTADATIVAVQRQAGAAKAADAGAALPGVLGATSHKESDVAVTMSRDRRSAVLSFVTRVRGARDAEYRVSELIVRDDSYWKVAAGMWSEPKPNDAVNRAASAEAVAPFARVAPTNSVGNDPLTDAFFAMQKGPIDATAAARKDLVVFGSGVGERTVGGARFARPWAATWANHVPLDASGIIAKFARTGTTGWIATDIMLEKRTPDHKLYLVPFRLFLVFDQTLDGRWSLIHAHVATVAP